MIQLLGALIGGYATYAGAKEQSGNAAEASLFQQALMAKAGKNLQATYDDVISKISSNPTGYAGSKVQAAAYNPVNVTESQRNSVQGNIDNLGLIQQLVSGANRGTTSNDIERILNFDPNALSTLGNLSNQASQWSQGRLPQDAIQDIISNASSRSAAYGTPGGAAPATFRDLGLNSMDAVNRGASLFSQILGAAEQISPVSRQVASPQFFITPQQGLQTDLQQSLLDQQSRQNANNLNAAPDPALNMMAQLQLQAANNRASVTTGQAGMVQPNVMPYASIYGQIGNSIGQALTGMFGGGSQQQSYGGYNAGFGAGSGGFNPAAYNSYALSYNQNASSGTAPKAYVV